MPRKKHLDISIQVRTERTLLATLAKYFLSKGNTGVLASNSALIRASLEELATIIVTETQIIPVTDSEEAQQILETAGISDGVTKWDLTKFRKNMEDDERESGETTPFNRTTYRTKREALLALKNNPEFEEDYQKTKRQLEREALEKATEIVNNLPTSELEIIHQKMSAQMDRDNNTSKNNRRKFYPDTNSTNNTGQIEEE